MNIHFFFLFTDKDVLKAFSSHNITYQEEKLKRHKKTLEFQRKRIAQNKTKENYHKSHGKRQLKKEREIDEANVEGDLYTIVRSNEITTLKAIAKINSPNEKMYSSAKNMKETPNIVNINLKQERNIEDDKVGQMISYCIGDLQCSKHASCVRNSLKNEGFCRCLSGFYGPGIFCREDM